MDRWRPMTKQREEGEIGKVEGQWKIYIYKGVSVVVVAVVGRPFRLLTFHRVDHGMRARVLLFGERRGKRALDFAAP